MRSWSSNLSSAINIDQQALAFYLMNFLTNLGMGILAPVLPEIKAHFGISYGEVGMVVSAFGLSRVLFDLPVGWAAERFKPSLILLLGTFLLCVGSVYAALSSSFVELLLSRLVMGAGSSMCATTATITLAHLSTPENRAKTLSMFPVAAYGGASFGPAIGGYLALMFDWRASFYFCAITTFLSFVSVAVTQRNRRRTTAAEGSSRETGARRSGKVQDSGIGGLSQSTIFRAIVAANAASVIMYFSRQGLLQAMIPLYARSVLGLDVDVIGTLVSASAIVGIFALSSGGFLADRYGRMQVIVPGMSVLILGAIVLPFTQNLGQLLIPIAFISLAAMQVSMPGVVIADLSTAKTLTRNLGFYRFAIDVGVFAGPVTLTTLVDYFGFGPPLFLDAALVAAGMVAALLLIPRGQIGRKASAEAGGV